MLPTQPINCGKHWWSPHFDYHMNSRFAWPTPPPQVAEAAAAAGALGAGAGAGVHAAEGAAANFASGGVPPRGPWGYHNYYGGYGRYGRYGRRWGRRPPSRLFWLLIGIGGTAWYFKHQQHRREFERRLVEGTTNTQTERPAQAWGWNHQCRHRQLPSSPTSSSAPLPTMNPVNSQNPSEVQPAIPTRFPDELDDGRMAWGWKAWRERKAAREEAWRLAKQHERDNKGQFQEKDTLFVEPERQRQSTQTQTSEMSKIDIPTFDQTPKQNVNLNSNQDNGEMSKLKEAFEKLWEEKKNDAVKVSETANDKAKEYAREKLDKLSAALDTLRESLKQDAELKAQKARESEKKWV